jgi:hypothetical protein
VSQHRRPGLLDLGLLIAVGVFAVLFAYVYAASERTFYTWDTPAYHTLVLRCAEAFARSLRTGLAELYWSLSEPYNRYFTLPLVPFVWLFGDSRLVYVLSLVVVYHLPLVFTVGALAGTLVPEHPRGAFWSGVALALLVPTTWLPTVIGFPDAGAATLIGLAVLVHLRSGPPIGVGPALLVGFLAAWAILLRRHYLFGATALFATMALDALQVGRLTSDLWRRVAQIALAGAGMVVTLLIFGWPMLAVMVTEDFRPHYASYQDPPLYNVAYYASTFGWLLCALSVLGFVSGLALRTVARRRAGFIAVLGAIAFVQWIFLVGQTYPHFTLHFTAIVLLGLVALTWTLAAKLPGGPRLIVRGGAGAGLAINLALTLVPASAVAARPARSLLVARHRPVIRADHGEVVRLMTYLRSLASPQDPIFVAASSQAFNFETLSAAEDQVHGKGRRRLWILRSPDIDSRDRYPLEMVVMARYAVVATPFQHHIAPEEQKVVRIAHDIFVDGWELAGDFRRLPEEFRIEGARIIVYERQRPARVEAAARALATIRKMVGRRPGRQPDWVSLGPAIAQVDTLGGNRHLLRIGPDPLRRQPADAWFVHIGAVPDTFELTADIDVKRLPSVALGVGCIDGDGRVTDMREVPAASTEAPRASVGLEKCRAGELLLSVTGLPAMDAERSWLELGPLGIRPRRN